MPLVGSNNSTLVWTDGQRVKENIYFIIHLKYIIPFLKPISISQKVWSQESAHSTVKGLKNKGC